MSLFIKPFWIEAKNRLIINTALALDHLLLFPAAYF